MRLSPIIGALCCLVLSIGSVTWLITLTQADPILLEPTVSHPAQDVSLVRRGLASESSFRAITERPLFQPSRRPALPPAQVQPAPPVASTPPAPEGSLLGVVIGPDRHTAILRLADSRSIVVAEGGPVVAGWTLQKVSPDRIVLISGDRSIEWVFSKHTASETSAATAAVGWPPLRRRN